MENTEELLRRIELLEKENARLKNQKKANEGIVPRDLQKEYPWICDTYLSFATPLSKAIRTSCFPHTGKQRTRSYKGVEIKQGWDYSIAIKEMTEGQYKKYCDCLRDVLAAMKPYWDENFTKKEN